jgi:hypothetical protein
MRKPESNEEAKCRKSSIRNFGEPIESAGKLTTTEVLKNFLRKELGMKKILFFLFFAALVGLAHAGDDVLYLKDGSVLHGTVLEMTGTKVKFEDNNGDIRVFKMADVDSVKKVDSSDASAETSSNSENTAPRREKPSLGDNLNKKGRFVFEVGDSDWIGNTTYLNDIYGETFTDLTPPIGVKISAGAAYAVSNNFLVGAKAQFLTQAVSISTNGDQWTEHALGFAPEVEGIAPLGPGINFIGAGEVGIYTLVGTSLTTSPATTFTFNSTTVGGMVSAGLEFLIGPQKKLGLDFGLAYEILTFNSLNYTATNGITTLSGTLQNPDGSNSSMDFSGLGFFATLRFL